MPATVVDKYASNGVSFGCRYNATAADVSTGSVIIDFNTDYNIAAAIMVTNVSTSAVVALTGALVTYPTYGQVQIANNGAYTMATTDLFNIVAQRAT